VSDENLLAVAGEKILYDFLLWLVLLPLLAILRQNKCCWALVPIFGQRAGAWWMGKPHARLSNIAAMLASYRLKN
jgi:hypothetical protein